MFKRELKKHNIIKRFILKLFNIYGFDKETFSLVNPNINNVSKNHYDLNNKTFILSSGFLELKRKVSSIDVFYRFSPSVDLWNSQGDWKRIIPNITKEKLIEVSLKSLKASILFFTKK